MSDQKTALVVGASRGLGLGLTKALLAAGWNVIATVRPGSSLKETVESGGKLSVEHLDVNDPATISSLKQRIGTGKLDLLFVNAGVSLPDGDQIATISDSDFDYVMRSNVLGPMRVVHQLLAAVKSDAAVGVMSSDWASSDVAPNDWDAYTASKVALNYLMRSVAANNADTAVTFMCLVPGWVKTDMGGSDASLDVKTAAGGLVKTIEARRGTGGILFVDYKNDELRW
ncbi:SDR family NAD(P)-dependent oxidoreductase [Rhizobium sp. 2MFCol3.1]|uniref:SDR family NAD(P)-dependent oxidoreductase n=1 Tax=Rhizobium sp. 2MFCol3.1 TaxID=1246459 RepID=UPI00037D12B2|nr:SDR family NAD(P)-dependent oxidoreductase [Rhizobium sp. 2MFCol3.1]